MGLLPEILTKSGIIFLVPGIFLRMSSGGYPEWRAERVRTLIVQTRPSVSCPRCPDRKRPLFKNQVHFRPRSGWVPEEASSRRISGHVTGMALPMGVREVPKEMTVGSSIGPTASEDGCVSWKGGRVDLQPMALIRLPSTRA